MADSAGHADHGTHHYNYVKIYFILLALLFVSIVGPLLEIKIITLITAFGVAGVKASLVIKYFMHLTTQKPFVHYFLITALVFMVLFFAGTAPDVRNHDGLNWDNVSAKAEIERALAEQEAGGAHHGEEASHEGSDDEAHH